MQLTIRDQEIVNLLRDEKSAQGIVALLNHIANLPQHLRKLDIVLWDTGLSGNSKTPALIYVLVQDDGRYIKYVFNISCKEAFKEGLS